MFMEKKEIHRIAAVTGLTGAALYTICAVFWLITPDFTAKMLGLLVHGLTFKSTVSLGVADFSLAAFIFGVILSFVIGALVGGFFAYFYGKVEV